MKGVMKLKLLFLIFLFPLPNLVYGDELPTLPLHYEAGVTLWPYAATDRALSHQFGGRYSSVSVHHRVSQSSPIAWTTTGGEMFRNKGRCLIYGPYRKHPSEFDVLAEIEVIAHYHRNLKDRNLINTDPYRNHVVFTIDLNQPGYDPEIKEIRIRDLNFKDISDNLHAIASGEAEWDVITFYAPNIPSEESTGYEVRLCIPENFEQAASGLLGEFFVKQYYIKEITINTDEE